MKHKRARPAEWVSLFDLRICGFANRFNQNFKSDVFSFEKDIWHYRQLGWM